MRSYKVNNIVHHVYDAEEELPPDVAVLVQDNWRTAKVGDWVRTDDDCFIQILRKGKMLRSKGRNKVREYVGTCTGTYVVGKDVQMDTSRRINIYSFGGNKSSDDILLDRTTTSKYEDLFVTYMASGMRPEEAYLKAFPTENRRYACQRAGRLIKTERIRTAMKEELKPILEDLGIDDKSVLSDIQTISRGAEKEDVRLRALFKLADILDLEDKQSTKVTNVTGALFQGFSNDMLEEVERPELTEKNKEE
ncbi:hypothetical protein CMI37_23455 [Candidatus Pacearchaeota archaeon]|nr:hypothetical protein [Candidatus Pacearchaeota archaeon]